MFLVGGSAWVEPVGTWVAGGKAAEFAVLPDRPEPIHLFVRNGATNNQITLDMGTWHDHLMMGPGDERVVDIPPSDGHPTMPLRVQSAHGFHPSSVDPNSDDARFLGVWIETR